MTLDAPDPRKDLTRLKLLYDVYRDYMKHEDDLINQRSTWHLLIQGFLFATMGVIGEWQVAKNVPDILHFERENLVYVLATVGIAISVTVAISMQAADNAIEALCGRWSKRIHKEFDPEVWDLVPAIAGGGAKTSKGLGKLAARVIPVFISFAWLAIAVMAFSGKHHPA